MNKRKFLQGMMASGFLSSIPVNVKAQSPLALGVAIGFVAYSVFDGIKSIFKGSNQSAPQALFSENILLPGQYLLGRRTIEEKIAHSRRSLTPTNYLVPQELDLYKTQMGILNGRIVLFRENSPQLAIDSNMAYTIGEYIAPMFDSQPIPTKQYPIENDRIATKIREYIADTMNISAREFSRTNTIIGCTECSAAKKPRESSLPDIKLISALANNELKTKIIPGNIG